MFVLEVLGTTRPMAGEIRLIVDDVADGPIFMGPEIWFLVLRGSTKVADASERIGIGSWDRRNEHRMRPERKWDYCGLFEDAEVTTVRIV
jgi:hypothetical protein